jgi:hypothetical protein
MFDRSERFGAGSGAEKPAADLLNTAVPMANDVRRCRWPGELHPRDRPLAANNDAFRRSGGILVDR